MAINIKLDPTDELKIIKDNFNISLPVKQIHKNKKAYNRKNKHQSKNYN